MTYQTQPKQQILRFCESSPHDLDNPTMFVFGAKGHWVYLFFNWSVTLMKRGVN